MNFKFMKKHLRPLFAGIAVSITCLSAAPALAVESEEELKMEKAFKAADKNSDGKLSPAEAKDGMPRVSKNFKRIDKDKDGFVTLAEIQAVMAEKK